MGTVNGVEPVDRIDTTQSQLGKRKRSSSATSNIDVESTNHDGASEDPIYFALKIIQQDDSGRRLLEYPLPSSRVKDGPATKRRRTQSANHITDTISSRIDDNTYKSLDQLLNDLDEVKSSIESQVNGHKDEEALSLEEIDRIYDLITDYQHKQPDINLETTDGLKEKHPALQLLSLRGQTDSGVRQLFTGLPTTNHNDSTDADTKRLPNGFELIDSALLNVTGSKEADSRTFGDVFTSFRSLKHLEPPRQFKTQESQLDFAPTLSKLGSSNKQDYKNMSLGTGAWLSYATDGLHRIKGDSATPSASANATNFLFNAAFSSFAPSVDHSASVVTDSDRARQWFKSKAMVIPLAEIKRDTAEAEINTEDKQEEEQDTTQIKLVDNLEELIQNYLTEADVDDRDEGEKILEEISELIQTLSSYQAIRDMDHARGPGSNLKLTQPELDTYELLRTQLQLLIDSLPPHAVAKLDGDQVKALNIKTNIVLKKPDITGTAQADDYTIRKQRGMQQASHSTVRGPVSTSVRQSYATPNATYGQQTAPYVQNTPTTTSYGARPPGGGYNTPRTAMPAQSSQYAQQPYRAPTTSYTTPAGQPQQQNIINSKYNQAYIPRPSQPGYQQRAQDRASSWQRPDSPPKPMANGQTPQQYQPRQYGSHSQGLASSQPRSLEQMKQPQTITSQSVVTS